jgi:hypothetical protein
MNTLNEIVYNIAETLGIETDFPTIQRLKDKVLHFRALLLRRSAERNGKIPSEFVQSIVMDTFESGLNNGIEFGVPIQWVTNIPATIELKGMDDFVYVGSIDKISPYTKLASPSQILTLEHNRFTKDNPYYIYQDSNIGLVNVFPEKLLIRAPFEDPRNVKGWDEESDSLPISADILQMVIQSVVSSETPHVPKNIEQEVNIEPENPQH